MVELVKLQVAAYTTRMLTRKTMNSRHMSRKEAAHDLGISVSSLRLLENQAITPIRVQGKTYFLREDVRLLALKLNRENLTGGSLAAQIFQAFREDKSFTDIVMQFKVDPTTVRELYYEYKTDLEQGYARSRTAKAARLQEQRAEQERELKEEERKEEFHQAMLTKIETGFMKG